MTYSFVNWVVTYSIIATRDTHGKVYVRYSEKWTTVVFAVLFGGTLVKGQLLAKFGTSKYFPK